MGGLGANHLRPCALPPRRHEILETIIVVLLDNAISLKSKEDSAFAYHAIPWLEGADRDTDDAGPSDLKSDAVSGSGGVEHILVFAPQHRPAML